ncbi:MAG: SAM-dependent methyltransferase [bacterium]
MQNIDEFSINTEKTDVVNGKLLIVSTPIGNKNDYTIRAVNALKIVDYVVCEEMKEGARILRELNISKELITLNEQNENEQADEVIKLIKEGNKVALVSDCGTPVFADPGSYLVQKVIQLDLPIEIVPGVSSIMTAIVRSGLDINKFYYAGFVSRKPEERYAELTALSKMPSTIVLLETPYRLLPLLQAASDIMPHRQAYLAFNLTTIFESHHYGTLKQLYEKFNETKVKAEFVLCFEGSKSNSYPLEHSTEVKPKPFKRPIKRDEKPFRKREERGTGRDFDRPRNDDRSSDRGAPRGRSDDRSSDRGGERRHDDSRTPERGSWRNRDDERRPQRSSDRSRNDDRTSERGYDRSRDDSRTPNRDSWRSHDDERRPQRSNDRGRDENKAPERGTERKRDFNPNEERRRRNNKEE